jgi:DNA-binding GntR family transcriptional regulator
MKRQDTGLALFDAARASLGDLARARPLLRELTRLYNPLVNGPLVDPPTHARIVEALEAGQVGEAERLLDERLALYAPGEGGAPDPERYRDGAGPFRDL